MQQNRFLNSPRPQGEVVELLERLLVSAQQGHLRSLAVVAVNPANESETAAVGELGPVRTVVLIGGLSKAANDLLNRR